MLCGRLGGEVGYGLIPVSHLLVQPFGVAGGNLCQVTLYTLASILGVVSEVLELEQYALHLEQFSCYLATQAVQDSNLMSGECAIVGVLTVKEALSNLLSARLQVESTTLEVANVGVSLCQECGVLINDSLELCDECVKSLELEHFKTFR